MTTHERNPVPTLCPSGHCRKCRVQVDRRREKHSRHFMFMYSVSINHPSQQFICSLQDFFLCIFRHRNGAPYASASAQLLHRLPMHIATSELRNKRTCIFDNALPRRFHEHTN